MTTDRYFILEGYELHEFKGSEFAAALRVVDLRGSVARVPADGEETRVNHLGDKLFQFRVCILGLCCEGRCVQRFVFCARALLATLCGYVPLMMLPCQVHRREERCALPVQVWHGTWSQVSFRLVVLILTKSH